MHKAMNRICCKKIRMGFWIWTIAQIGITLSENGRTCWLTRPFKSLAMPPLASTVSPANAFLSPHRICLLTISDRWLSFLRLRRSVLPLMYSPRHCWLALSDFDGSIVVISLGGRRSVPLTPPLCWLTPLRVLMDGLGRVHVVVFW